jgi:hypothetical protein
MTFLVAQKIKRGVARDLEEPGGKFRAADPVAAASQRAVGLDKNVERESKKESPATGGRSRRGAGLAALGSPIRMGR